MANPYAPGTAGYQQWLKLHPGDWQTASSSTPTPTDTSLPGPGATPGTPATTTASFKDPYTGLNYSDPNFQINEASISDAMKNASPEGKNALLKNLKSRLDSGQIQTADFLKLGTPLASAVSNDLMTLGGRGSTEAARGQTILQDFLQNSGFKQSAPGHADVVSNLPADKEQDVRKSVLPGAPDPGTNLPPDVSKTIADNTQQATDQNAIIQNKQINDIPTDIPISSDQGQIEKTAIREAQQQQDTLTQSLAARTQGLSQLGDVLQKQNEAQFNYDLPNIKEQLQGSGLYSSDSALAAAVARESGMLGANTTAQLGQYGVDTQNMLAQGQQAITAQQTGMETGGLQRTQSLADFQKQIDLAKSVAGSNIPQAPGFNWANAGSAAGLAAITGAAGSIAKGNGTSGGSCFIIGHLFKLKIIKRKEAFNVHLKLADSYKKYSNFFHLYYAIAPIFVLRADAIGFDWHELKPKVTDQILACKTAEEAFLKFKSVCFDIMPRFIPELLEI